MNKLNAVLLILLAFFVGVNVGGYFYQPPYITEIFNATNFVSTEGLTEVDLQINVTTVHLIGGCYEVSFDVTPDQAFSISRGIEKNIGARPLTHDIMKDVLDTFGISILQIRIDRYDDGIYYATIVLLKDNKILELDARPSDSIALALRTGRRIYFKRSLLETSGGYVC